MDRNPSPPPPSCDQEDEEDLAGGDCIGSTVYSKHWLFGVLSGLILIVTLESDKSGSDDDEQQMELAEEMETEICRVWDMSMDEDVALFLQEFKAPDIFMGVLAKSRCPRLRCDGAEKLLLSSDIIALGSPCTKVLLTCGWPCCMENYCAAIHMKLQHTEFYAGFDDGWIPETSEEWKLLLHLLQNKSTRPTPKESLNGSLSDGPAPINVENVALLLAKAMGPDRAWSLLQECGLALELSAKFTRTCDILRIAERRQRALIQGMLEKCDRFLWSQQAEWEICRDTISF